MNITRGVVAKAQKVVVYGPEGIGKSSFAAQFPNPLFIDTEGSTSNMDVMRMDRPTSWTMLLQQIAFVKQNKPCQTLVIDTIDWAERLATEFIVSNANKTSITSFGYGEGFIKLEEEFGKFLNKLSDLVEIGINVVLTAHAKITKFEQPDEMGAYDRWELKLGNKTTAKTAPLTKEWSDMVLFCNYKTYSVATDDKGKKFKGQGGKRVIYTTHHPAWDAKNRFGLPDEIDLDYNQIRHIIEANTPVVETLPVQTASPIDQNATQAPPVQQVPENQPVQNELPNQSAAQQPVPDFSRPQSNSQIPQPLQDLMTPENVTEFEIQQVVAAKGYYPADTPIENYDPGFVQGVLVGAWDQVFGMIKNMREKQPF